MLALYCIDLTDHRQCLQLAALLLPQSVLFSGRRPRRLARLRRCIALCALLIAGSRLACAQPLNGHPNHLQRAPLPFPPCHSRNPAGRASGPRASAQPRAANQRLSARSRASTGADRRNENIDANKGRA